MRLTFAIEGTGSYGAGLTAAVRRRGVGVVEAPQLAEAFGVGPDTAAEMLIDAGDSINRVRAEPAWARLCGVAPVSASSGLTTRHRLNRGGHRRPTPRRSAC